jgi:hypothetical protein
MVMPHETPTDTRAADPSGTIPANTNKPNVVGLSVVEYGFTVIENKLADLKTARFADVMGPISDLQDTVTGLRQQIVAAAVEVLTRTPDAQVEITDTPAIIVRRSIGEAISRGDLRPGQKLPGQDIILAKVWEPINRRGERLGRNVAHFGAPENLPGEPRTFSRNQAAIGNLVKWHGHDGWKFDPQRYGTSSYEDARFKGYQDGSAIGNWGVPELPVLNGQNRDRNTVGNPSENMLALSRDGKSDFKNFVTISGSVVAPWSQSCTEYRGYPGIVLTVRFPGGYVGWDLKDDGRSCVRPSVALELSHLII